jgi:uncharacterized protein with ParB-like and HNH nuclease domain
MSRSTLLNTDTEDLKELLSNGKNYTVPPYQRDYSWKQEHWGTRIALEVANNDC